MYILIPTATNKKLMKRGIPKKSISKLKWKSKNYSNKLRESRKGEQRQHTENRR